MVAESYESLKKVSSKDEDWKYIELSDEINDFQVSKNESELHEDLNFHINFNGVKSSQNTELNSYYLTNLEDLTTPLIDSYYKRPLDRFIAQQYQKNSGGIVIKFSENNEEFIKLNLQNNQLAIPYIGINVEKNVTAKLLINFGDMVSSDMYSIIEISAKQNSNLEIIIDNNTSNQVKVINTIYGKIEKDAFLNIHTVSTGASLSRNRIDIDLVGNGAGFNIDGVYFGENTQTHDNRVFVNHIAKNTSSNMLTKGVLGDSSKSVFTGTIHIAEGATKTESHQENRNILISKTASAQSVPTLEILCDDVICGHGSSVGPIEENLYHYVMSRGINKVNAEKLLIKGFFNEVLNKRGWESISKKVANEIMKKYSSVLSHTGPK